MQRRSMTARVGGVNAWRAISLLVIVALFTLAPLAQASPPDQTWLGGLYDNADFDDVVIIITSSVGLADAAPCIDLQPALVLLDTAPQLAETGVPSADVLAAPSRAPPLA